MALVHPIRYYSSHYYNGQNGSSVLNQSDSESTNINTMDADRIVPSAEFVLQSVLIPIIALIGIICNIFVIRTFTCPQLRRSPHYFMTYLGILDIGVLLLAIFTFPNAHECHEHENGCNYFQHFSILSYPLTLFFHFASLWVCVVLIIERFMTSYYRENSQKRFTKRTTGLLFGLILLVGFMFSISRFFAVLSFNKDPIPSDIFENLYVIYPLFLFLIPWSLFLIFGFLLAKHLYKSKKDRLKTTLNVTTTFEQKEQRSSLAALLVVGTFLLLNLPGTINNIYRIDHTRDLLIPELLFIFLGNVFVCVSCLTRILIYWNVLPNFKHLFLSHTSPCMKQYLSAEYQFASSYPEGKEENYGIISMKTISSKKKQRELADVANNNDNPEHSSLVQNEER